jgi:hypothetical protein
MIAADLKPRLEELRHRPRLSTAETRSADGNPDWVCACGEPEGALYYACSHNRSAEKDAPLIITFESDVRDATVDGRDFLYTIFQMGHPEKARRVVERIFGRAIIKYVDRAWSSDDQDERIAICDLATQDAEVVAAHAGNTSVIAGRHRTHFRSAFFVRLPVTHDRIVDVQRVRQRFVTPPADVSLQDLLRR